MPLNQIIEMLEEAKSKHANNEVNKNKLNIDLGEVVGDGTFASVYINKAVENEVVKVIDVPYSVSRFYPDYDTFTIDEKIKYINQRKYITKKILEVIYHIFEQDHPYKKYLVAINNDCFVKKLMEEGYHYPLALIRMPYLKTMDYYIMDFHEATYIDMMLQLAYGLKAIHDQNYLHRDIKPDNIFVAELENGTLNFKIGDFGLMAYKEPNEKIKEGVSLKTKFFASPEAKEGKYGFFSDIYSLGVSVHYMASGGYHRGFVMDLLNGLYGDTRAQSFDRIPNCSEQFWNILQKCIMKDYNKRYQTIEDLIYDLETLRDQNQEEVAYCDFNSKEFKEKQLKVLQWRELYHKCVERIETMKKGLLSYFSIKKIFNELPAKTAIKTVEEKQETYIEPFDCSKLLSLPYCIQQSELGNIYAINNLACMYAEGKYVKKDYQRALMYFKMVEDELEEAKQNLLQLRKLGVDIHGKHCASLNVEQLENKTNLDVIEMYQLVHYYYANEKYDDAMKWLMKACEQNDYLSLRLLEEEYRSGCHIHQNLEKAEQLKKQLVDLKQQMNRLKPVFLYVTKEKMEE